MAVSVLFAALCWYYQQYKALSLHLYGLCTFDGCFLHILSARTGLVALYVGVFTAMASICGKKIKSNDPQIGGPGFITRIMRISFCFIQAQNGFCAL